MPWRSQANLLDPGRPARRYTNEDDGCAPDFYEAAFLTLGETVRSRFGEVAFGVFGVERMRLFGVVEATRRCTLLVLSTQIQTGILMLVFQGGTILEGTVVFELTIRRLAFAVVSEQG